MAIFELQGPDGKTYEIDAPDENAALEAFQSFNAPSQKPKQSNAPNAIDVMKGFTPLGVAENLYSAAKDPMAAFQRVDDGVRAFADGVTFGYGDKAAAGIDAAIGQGNYQQNLSENRQMTADAMERGGAEAMAANVVGGALGPSKMASMGLTAAKIPGMLGRYGGLAIDGAVIGGLNAAGHDEDIAQGAGLGFAGGAAGQAVAGTVNSAGSALARALRGKPSSPSIDDFEAAKNAAYQAVDDAGEAYTPEQISALATGVNDDLVASGVDPVLNPAPYRFGEVIAARINAPRTTLRELDKIDSKVGRKLLTSNDSDDRYLGGVIRDNISEFMDANGGSELIDTARTAHKKYKNLERVLGQVTKAERRASSTGSGGNEDNAIRQNIRAILDNPRTSKFYNADERAAMDKVISGTSGQNLARRIGKMSPENGGLMAGLSTMGAALNPLISIPAAAGFVSKRVADRATKKNLEELVYLLSSGEQLPKPKTMSRSNQEALARLLMSGSLATASE